VRTPPLVLVVDDNVDNLAILEARLLSQGYDILTGSDGEEGLRLARERQPDVILLDVMMPGLNGFDVCRRIKGDPSLPFMPIILVTAKAALDDVVAGLDAGADEYLTKPVDHAALLARLRSILRIKALHDQVQEQAAELASWNRTLEERVAEQVGQIERLARLRRFLSPQVADLILSAGGEALLESHRREVVVLFCDLRGFTAFAEQASPAEVMRMLKDYHKVVGGLIDRYEGTLERFLGDGVMVLFNDPVPCPDPDARALRMALDIRQHVGELAAQWRGRGFELGCGLGIARGEATLGRIGFEGRFDYAAIGSVANLAARLCAEAADGEILVSPQALAAVEDLVDAEPLGELPLKGFLRPITTYRVRALRRALPELTPDSAG
jgi:class 3 adenylate cyclase/CheY-like chemotaxis protein